MNIEKNILTIFEENSIVKENCLISQYTSFKTGGRVSLVLEPKGKQHLSLLLKELYQRKLAYRIIGGGTNLLISDQGLDEIVIVIDKNEFWQPEFKEENGLIYAEAVMRKKEFVEKCLDAGFDKTQFMAGIPGCLGGGIYMNAGTFMGTFVEILDSIEVLDEKGEFHLLKVDKEQAEYRSLGLADNLIITGAYFKLPQIEDKKEGKREVVDILKDRNQKHPLEFPSAGSVFKNPTGLASWKLVNDSGLKGYRLGGAMVSEKHTNFIINYNKATSQDIYSLIRLIQMTVKEKFEVDLQTEVRIIGEFTN